MFNQCNLGTCYLVAAFNTIKQISSIFEYIFVNKEYDSNRHEYKFNIFINGILKQINLDDKFVYIKQNNDKLTYIGCQTYKHELFLKFIEKLYAEIKRERAVINSSLSELEISVNLLNYIEGGYSNYLYGCLLGTSSITYSISDSNEFEKEKNN